MDRLLLTLTVLTIISSTAYADDEISPDFYPGIGFTVLDQDERRQFIDLAGSEACPCPGAERTLSDCLQAPEGRCRSAVQLASLMMRRLKEDMPATEVREAMANLIAVATTPLEFDLAHTYYRGSPEAALQLVVFSDFECPFCREFAGTLDLLGEIYGDQICIYFKHFPLPQHQAAEPAARAANAAGRQGQFWQMHDLLFANQAALRDVDLLDLLMGYARELGLDIDQFADDLEDPTLAEQPSRDRAEAQAAGVNSTPTLFINGLEYADDWSAAGIRAYLNALAAPR